MIVVSIYTYYTYQLFKSQKEQFRLSVRPWIYPGDIIYEYQPSDAKLAILLFNFGKLPALVKISVESITIKPLLLEQVKPVQVNMAREFPVFPHVEGVDSVFMFFIPLTYDQSVLLIDGCRLEIPVKINYRSLTESGKDFPYSYSATLTVNSFKETMDKQSTLIGNVVAT
jgi:hypothetical protein